MLALSRPHRQALATLALIVFTVVPTGYVALTAWRIHQPGHRRNVEVEIGQRLGLHVTLDSVRYPRPGEVVYQGIVLRQPESRVKQLTEIARADTVTLRRAGREIVLDVDALTLRGESPRRAMDQVVALLQRASNESFDQISLTARSCEVALAGDARTMRYTLRDVAGTLQLDAGVPTIRAAYGLVEAHASSRCELVLSRDRSVPSVTLTFKTVEGLPLPARVLNPFFDATDWLGPSARVGGALVLSREDGSDWEAEFRGALVNVDLGVLVNRRFPGHYLSGQAHILIESARWTDRPGQGFGWSEAQGELTSGPGTIGLGLLRALGSEMKFRVVSGAERRQPLEFGAAGLAFAMSRDGEIQLDGALGSAFAPDVVMIHPSRDTPLAFAPQGAANVRGLIRALFPDATAQADVQVPATSETVSLHRYLPVPPGSEAMNRLVGGSN